MGRSTSVSTRSRPRKGPRDSKKATGVPSATASSVAVTVVWSVRPRTRRASGEAICRSSSAGGCRSSSATSGSATKASSGTAASHGPAPIGSPWRRSRALTSAAEAVAAQDGLARLPQQQLDEVAGAGGL